MDEQVNGREGRKEGKGGRVGGREGGREVERREKKNTTVKCICSFKIVFTRVISPLRGSLATIKGKLPRRCVFCKKSSY